LLVNWTKYGNKNFGDRLRFQRSGVSWR